MERRQAARRCLAPRTSAAHYASRLDGASRLQAKLVPRESIGGEALYVQDPLDAENNVGRSCFAFHQVQQVFRDPCEP